MTSRLSIVITILFGLAVAFHPVFRSGFEAVPGDLGDARLGNWILETGFQWVSRNPIHLDFWNHPIFFPAKNMAAYTEILLGSGPIYWLYRILGLQSDTSFLLWEMSVLSLNFISMFWLLTLFFRKSAANVGAFLFAFASARLAQFCHPQLLPQFFTPLAVGGMIQVFRTSQNSIQLRWLGLSALAAVGQLYACFYLGWFLGFLGTITFAAILFDRDVRSKVIRFLKAEPISVAAIFFASAILLLPMAAHYLAAAREAGPRPMSDVSLMLPRLKSWFFMGSSNLIYGGMASWQKYLPERLPRGSEHALGLGFVTLAMTTSGLLGIRKSLLGRVAIAVLATTFVLTLWVAGYHLWHLVFETIPGAKAIRAVSRIQLALLVPWAIGLAAFVQKYPRWAIPVLFIVALEQAQTYEGYSKSAANLRSQLIAAKVPSTCPAFLLAPLSRDRGTEEQHIDAMWAAEILQKPTLNGYSGNVPRGWDLETTDPQKIPEALARWQQATGFILPPECVVSL